MVWLIVNMFNMVQKVIIIFTLMYLHIQPITPT